MMANNPRWAQISADANQARAREAGHHQATLARAALDVLQRREAPDAHVSRWIQVLQQRLDRPEASMAELGQSMSPPLTKHAYSALLRRALHSAGVSTRADSPGTTT